MVRPLINPREPNQALAWHPAKQFFAVQRASILYCLQTTFTEENSLMGIVKKTKHNKIKGIIYFTGIVDLEQKYFPGP